MPISEFNNFVNSHDWTFAKSQPKNPHFYVVREKCRSDQEFINAVLFVRKHGVPRKFFSKTFVYYDFKGWSYWSMGLPIDYPTIILNRAKIIAEENDC